MFLTARKFICGVAKFVSFNDLNPTYQTIPSLGFLYDDIKQLFADKFSEIVLLKSCNGLLLSVVTFKSNSSRPRYCVCNPTTKKSRLLPPTPFSLPLLVSTDYLAFEPSLSLHYKVICTESYRESQIYAFSSENNCWSTIAYPFHPYSFSCREWFLLNGSMYCAEKSLRLDVCTEKMEQITMPPKIGGHYTKNYLPVIGNRVYCAVRESHRKANLQILEMSSDLSGWILKYDVNFSPLLSAFPKIAAGHIGGVCYSFDAICVVDGVKEDEPELVLGIPGKLISYNLKQKTAKELCAWRGEKSHIISSPVYQFIECLSDV